MVKVPNNETFKVGETVACYAGDTLSFGEVLAVEEGTVTINRLVIPVPATREECVFILRSTDGLHVTQGSLHERVPNMMITNEDNITKVNDWRFNPSFIEKLKRRFIYPSYIYVPWWKQAKPSDEV